MTCGCGSCGRAPVARESVLADEAAWPEVAGPDAAWEAEGSPFATATHEAPVDTPADGADQEAGDWEQELEVIGPDSRRRVSPTTGAPFRYICNLDYDYPGRGRWAMCSGTLIGPRTVLTAGHCLHGLDATRCRVIPGRDGTLEPLPATAGAAFLPYPGYVGSSPTDLGLLHLADPVGTTVGFWGGPPAPGLADPVGTSVLTGALPAAAASLRVNLSGYPADRPGGRGCTDPARPAARCRHSVIGAATRQRICGTMQYRSYDRAVLASPDGMLHYTNDSCPGHSGSPVWVRRDPGLGGRVLVAVHVARDDGAGPLANRGVLITPTVRAWIAANTV